MTKGWEHWDDWRTWLEARMTERGWPPEAKGSQRRFAEAGGITFSAVSQWLDPQGTRPQPSAENVRKVAEALKLPIKAVYVAAHYMTAEEADVALVAEPSLADFTTHQLLTEIGQRVRELENAAEEASEQPAKPEPKPRRESKRRLASARQPVASSASAPQWSDRRSEPG